MSFNLTIVLSSPWDICYDTPPVQYTQMKKLRILVEAGGWRLMCAARFPLSWRLDSKCLDLPQHTPPCSIEGYNTITNYLLQLYREVIGRHSLFTRYWPATRDVTSRDSTKSVLYKIGTVHDVLYRLCTVSAVFVLSRRV